MEETKQKILRGIDEEYKNLLNEIEEKEQEVVDKEQEIEDLDDWELPEDEYDEILDDCCEVVRIGSLEYSPSQVLKNVDSVAYNCGLSEEEDRVREDKRTELEGELDDLKDELEGLKEQKEDYENENN